MTQESFEAVVRTHLDIRPFRVFTVELNTGKRIEIDHPQALAMKDRVVAFIGPGGYPHWFDCTSVHQILSASTSDLSGDPDKPAA
jgi:hypothetical protein